MSQNHPLRDAIAIFEPVWPKGHSGPRPGNFSLYAPKGLAMDVPMIVQPWDTLERAAERPAYYGAEAQVSDPILNAPANWESGGCVYFDGAYGGGEIATMLKILGVQTRATEYAAFLVAAEDTVKERFLHQLRIVQRHGLAGVFGIRAPALDETPHQKLTIGEAIAAFLDAEREIWGTGFSSALSGTLGGDGDWAREALAFGILAENSYAGVYRIWSRPCLVTK